jgi:hypothetical protein
VNKEPGPTLRLVDDRTTADVEGRRGHGAGMVRSGEGRYVAHVFECRGAAQHGRRHDVPLDYLLAFPDALGDRLRYAAGLQGDPSDAVRAELDRQLPTHRLYGVEGRLGATDVVVANGISRAAEEQDRARTLPDHVPRRRPRGQESSPYGGRNGHRVILDRHLGHRSPVYERVRDEVEGDVYAPRLRRHGVRVFVDGPLVEGIYLRRLGHSARGTDVGGHLVERREGAAGEEDPGPLAGEGAKTAPPMAPPAP